MSYALQHVQTKVINHGTLRVLSEDSPSGYVLGPAIPIEGVRDAPFSLDIDSAENKTEGYIQALYGRILKGESSLTVGKIGLAGLKALVGAELVESAGVNAIVRIRNTSQLPYIALQYQSNWLPGLEGRARFFVRHRKAKLRELSFEIGQDDFASMELSFASEFSLYPIEGEQELMMLGSEMATGLAGGMMSYLPARTNLPLWMFVPSSGANWALITSYTQAEVRRRTVLSNTAGSGAISIPVTLVPGVVYAVDVMAFQGTIYGGLAVQVDGVQVGALDFYHASLSGATEKSFSFIAPAGGPKRSLSLVATGTTGGSDDRCIVCNVEIYATEQVGQNRLPQILESRHDVPVAIFDRASAGAAPTFIQNMDGSEALEKVGIGNEFALSVWLEPGTYSISSKIAKSADGAIQSYYIDGVLLGTVDTYAGSTAYGYAATVPGTFQVTDAGRLVRISVLASSKNASSSGYRSHLGWLSVDRAAGATDAEGICGPSLILLEPHWATTNNFTRSSDGAQWGGTEYTTSSANVICQWDDVRIVPGRWRAWLLLSSASKDLALKVGGTVLHTFDPNPSSNGLDYRIFDFERLENGAFDVAFESVEAGASTKFNYAVLQRIG